MIPLFGSFHILDYFKYILVSKDIKNLFQKQNEIGDLEKIL